MEGAVEIEKRYLKPIERIRGLTADRSLRVIRASGEGGEEVREETAVQGFGEDSGGIGFEGYGERVPLADFVFQGAECLVESVDGEVDGAGSQGIVAGLRGGIDGEAGSAGDVGGQRESGSLRIEAEGEDEPVSPVGTEGTEDGEEAKGLDLGIQE